MHLDRWPWCTPAEIKHKHPRPPALKNQDAKDNINSLLHKGHMATIIIKIMIIILLIIVMTIIIISSCSCTIGKDLAEK